MSAELAESAPGTDVMDTPESEVLVMWSLRRIALTGLATRPGGATLLANRDGEPLVVPLDVLGRASAPAHLFKGARGPTFGGGQGIVLTGDRIAIVAAHGSGAHAMRILGADGKPEAGWVCLDAPSPDELHLASVVATGAGFTALVATASGSAVLALDATGMKSP